MSGDPADEAEFNKTIFEKISKYTKSRACPFCQNDKWYILNKIKDYKDISGMVVATNWNGVAAYTFFCTNCGFVRQHVKEIIDGEVRPPGETT
jgi:C4-type Zn-finger protein